MIILLAVKERCRRPSPAEGTGGVPQIYKIPQEWGIQGVDRNQSEVFK